MVTRTSVKWALSLLLLVSLNRAPCHSKEPSHPRLLFGPGDVSDLKERMRQEPLASAVRNFERYFKGELPRPAGADELDASMMATQLGGLFYTLTGNRSIAEKVKPAYLSRIGAWERDLPHYRTTYRRLCNLCLDYDLLEPAGIFNSDEKERIIAVLAKAATHCMQRGDNFNPYDYFAHEAMRVSNTNSDRLAAVGMFCLTFPEHRHSKVWLDHVVDEWIWQLENWVLKDGFFPEGSRYHGAVLRQMIPLAYGLQRHGGPDLFAHPKMKAMLEAIIQLQTPPDVLLGGVALIPGVADANWETVWEAVLGWSAPAYYKNDPAFSKRLMWAWHRAGSPVTVEFSPGNPAVGLLVANPLLPEAPQPQLENRMTSMGYVVLRNRFDSPEEGYFLLNATAIPNPGHQHADRGSFSLYAFSTPLALDPGVADYAVTRGQWYGRSRAHNMVTFGDHESGRRVEMTNHFFDQDLDYLEVDLSNAAGGGHIRHVLFFRPDIYLLWDDIGSSTPATFNLHVLGKPTGQDDWGTDDKARVDRVRFGCENNLEFDWFLLSSHADTSQPVVELGPAPHPARFYIEQNSMPTMVREQTPTWIRASQPSVCDDFVTILYPHRQQTSDLQITRVSLSGSEVAFIEFTCGDRKINVQLHRSVSSGGQVSVEIEHTSTGLRHRYLIGDTKVQWQDGTTIETDHPANLALHTTQPSKRYELASLGRGFEQVHIHITNVNSISGYQVTPIDDVHNGTPVGPVRKVTTNKHGVLMLTLNQRRYRIESTD